MRIDQLMKQPAITCRDTDTLNVAAQRMWEHDCGVLPVVDGTGKLAGIVTDRDICMAAFTQGLPIANIGVTTAMARAVFTCRPGDTVESAERLMADRQLRRLPVVDGGQHPVGVLSMSDIARHIGTTKNGGKDLTLQTFAAICRPREELEHRPEH